VAKQPMIVFEQVFPYQLIDGVASTRAIVRTDVVVSGPERLVGDPRKTPSHLSREIFKFLPKLEEPVIGESVLPHLLEAIVPTHSLMP
jgi:hypothetical protein